jgi:protein gp37
VGETSPIEWTDHTLNAWKGCTKVDALCKNCYAEVSTPVRVRRAQGLELWGPDGAREETRSWRSDLRAWDKASRTIALAGGPRRRCFAQSLSDTFEEHRDLDDVRGRLLAALAESDALDVQLLTKRPENILRMVPPAWLKSWPEHIWIGTSVGDQKSAETRIPHLLKVPARVRFLSVEPLLGPVALDDLVCEDGGPGERHYSALECDVAAEDDSDWNGATIAWVIVGGESGYRARPCNLAWIGSGFF